MPGGIGSPIWRTAEASTAAGYLRLRSELASVRYIRLPASNAHQGRGRRAIRKGIRLTDRHRIECRYLSQEHLLEAGCLDMNLAMEAAEEAMLAFRDGDIIFPDKIVQIFDHDTQERINCLPATLRSEGVCGVKWVSVFPMNPVEHGLQNLSAVILLSEIERGFPIAIMDGTLCSNVRVGAMGGVAAKHFARPDSKSIGFIGAGEQAKMHLIAMKTVVPSLEECRVSAKFEHEEQQFVDEMSVLFDDVEFSCAGTDGRAAMEGADILVTATSAQAPLLKADWMKPGSFYSHIGGWEDEYAVAAQCDTIVCDDWETVKHRTQTLSRMYQAGELADDDIAADLIEVVAGEKPGRTSADERVYFNAVGLAYVDVAIAYAMYRRAEGAGLGETLALQEDMIFRHDRLRDWIRM
jgi:ornithine cyclodeaminase/alanine dehydrogenase-like protein (mu-crystallin family)